MCEAYLDIETTGLSPLTNSITVVGVYLTDGREHKFTQLVGEEITPKKLMEALTDVKVVYTYNGGQFDIPFIRISLGIDLAEKLKHHDLMYDCWKCNLYGGLKAVEKRLGIQRRLKRINGESAVKLWHEYKNDQNQHSLTTLLRYNREDAVNLKVLKNKLSIFLSKTSSLI